MLLTGAQILIKTLIEQGVDTVFGYPGGFVINIYDELYKNSDKITHYTTCHEQGACHAADSYARVTGRPGVVIATSGPGATNLVTGSPTPISTACRSCHHRKCADEHARARQLQGRHIRGNAADHKHNYQLGCRKAGRDRTRSLSAGRDRRRTRPHRYPEKLQLICRLRTDPLG